MEENRNENVQQETENLSEILQIRRDKLTSLREADKDPFKITKFDADTHSIDIHENFDALEGNKECDVLIIGGGIAGILCAYTLKSNGIDCMLVEA